LALYLPRLAVLVSIEADRPWAWFPGIDLSRDIERVKVPENPMKNPFLFLVSLWGQILSITVCSRTQPNHVKHLLSGLCNLLKRKISLTRVAVRRPQGRALQPFFGQNLPPIFFFLR
jgi:hypothetical protein